MGQLLIWIYVQSLQQDQGTIPVLDVAVEQDVNKLKCIENVLTWPIPTCTIQPSHVDQSSYYESHDRKNGSLRHNKNSFRAELHKIEMPFKCNRYFERMTKNAMGEEKGMSLRPKAE